MVDITPTKLTEENLSTHQQLSVDIDLDLEASDIMCKDVKLNSSKISIEGSSLCGGNPVYEHEHSIINEDEDEDNDESLSSNNKINLQNRVNFQKRSNISQSSHASSDNDLME